MLSPTESTSISRLQKGTKQQRQSIEMDLQSGGISFPSKKAGIYLSSSLLPPFHSPFLSNLKGLEQHAYTHLVREEQKNPKTVKTQTTEQKISCIKGSIVPAHKMQQGTGRCKGSRRSKQHLDIQTQKLKA